MPFCPSCEAEYRDEVTVCPACNTALVPALDPAGVGEEMADVYVCYDEQLAERIVAMLKASGIEPLVRDRTSHAFPTTMGTSSERRVAVLVSEADRARRVLRDALEDGVLHSTDGELV